MDGTLENNTHEVTTFSRSLNMALWLPQPHGILHTFVNQSIISLL